MKKTTKLLAVLLAAVMIVGVLAGCQDTGTTEPAGSTTAGTTSAGTTSAPTTAAPTQPEAEKILIYGLSSYDGKFMPIMYDNVYNSQFCNLLFDSLVDINHEAEYIPELATWEMSNNNHTYTFTLKDGTKFSDGSPLTAEDVAFTFEMIAHPDYSGPRSGAVDLLVGYDEFHSGATQNFAGIEILNDRQIAFTYTEGNAGPANIANFGYGIMSKAYYEAPTFEAFLNKLSTPLGCGPFILEEYKPKELVRLAKDPGYWNIAEKEVKIDGVLCIEVPNENILGALQTKQIDFGELSVSMENVEAMDAIPGVTRYNFLANGYTFMCFNCLNGIFDDVRVRQAFMYSLDRKAFIKAEYGELAAVGLAPISPVSWAFPDLSELNAYDYDEAKAAALLDEAGWLMGNDGVRYKDGKKLSVRWLVYTDNTWPGTLSSMAADTWKKQGIDLQIELMDFNTVAAKTMNAPIGEKDFDIYTMGFSLGVDPDPKGGLFDADAYAEGGYNASGWRDDRSQELIQLGRTEFDQAKRAEYYKEWAKIQNEQVPTTLVAYRNYLWGISERIDGMLINAFCDWTYSIYDIDLNY